jgi:hypothetical protein
MALGDIFFEITNTGGNYTEVGLEVDPTSTVLPPVYGNESYKTFSYQIEFFANTGVTTNDPIYDLTVDAVPLNPGLNATKVSNNTVQVTSTGAVEYFAGESFDFITFVPTANGVPGYTTTQSKSILTARFYTPQPNETVLSWNAPTTPYETEYTFTITRDSNTSPVSLDYTQDIEWSGLEALTLFNNLAGV